MATLQKQFNEFHNEIKLNASREALLRTNRDAIKRRIENYFQSEKGFTIPTFSGQGSFTLRTVNNPLRGEYDIDYGVYLTNLDDEIENWPLPATAHKWIYDAVYKHTNQAPSDKDKCVRVKYKHGEGDKTPNHHVDLPIYGIDDGTIYLATKGVWVKSNAKGLHEWFNKKKKSQPDGGDQLRRIVRYYKAWTDYRGHNKYKGIMLTILSANNYKNVENNDGESFVKTTKAMADSLVAYRAVYVPEQYESEDLLAGWSKVDIDDLIENLTKLVEKGQKALDEDSESRASKIWMKLFGDRFPIAEDKNSGNGGAKTAASPAILTSRLNPHFRE